MVAAAVASVPLAPWLPGGGWAWLPLWLSPSAWASPLAAAGVAATEEASFLELSALSGVERNMARMRATRVWRGVARGTWHVHNLNPSSDVRVEIGSDDRSS